MRVRKGGLGCKMVNTGCHTWQGAGQFRTHPST
jgi:hypothetical protein